MKRERN